MTTIITTYRSGVVFVVAVVMFAQYYSSYSHTVQTQAHTRKLKSEAVATRILNFDFLMFVHEVYETCTRNILLLYDQCSVLIHVHIVR